MAVCISWRETLLQEKKHIRHWWCVTYLSGTEALPGLNGS